ncbi:hypothetical protein OI25_7488 [Paraburkholderia fungorum]|jgi:hypothetical protein|uniref:Uncharacterized protein n=1 Tax=Paraburkholderia fungorum TaxID=134537 RepID=A0AAP5QJ75_9BURK|nr:hypothetical protein [Paraburkholderia fungorum]AJZ57101.1 hypothetical protein OI25_7488 [Paraburkholderia fungorum]MDT8843272.1 hypothetical protein [Paraburkholderia fungorum]
MFDAEIAATLLNRWDRGFSTSCNQSPLDILHEGNLSFAREVGNMGAGRAVNLNSFHIECLAFVDGSRVLRIGEAGMVTVWTDWAAIEPLQPLPQHVSREARCARAG